METNLLIKVIFDVVFPCPPPVPEHRTAYSMLKIFFYGFLLGYLQKFDTITMAHTYGVIAVQRKICSNSKCFQNRIKITQELVANGHSGSRAKKADAH